MNPRFLKNETQLADGNDNIFWGLLFDVKMCFSNNFNTADKNKYHDSFARLFVRQQEQSFEQKKSNQIALQTPQNKESWAQQETPQKKNLLQKKNQPNITQSPSGYNEIRNQRSEKKQQNKETPRNISKTKQQSNENQDSLYRSNNKAILNETKQSSQKNAKNCVTPEMEIYVQTYFRQKKLINNELQQTFNHFERTLYNDPLRNGQLIFSFLNSQSIVYRTFSTVEDVKQNILVALEGVKALIDIGDMPVWISAVTTEEVIQFSSLAIGLYWWLIQTFKAPQATEVSNQSTSQYFQTYDSQSYFALPYKKEEIDQLKIVTLQWVREVSPELDSNTFQDIKPSEVQSYNQMIELCQSGRLLCQATSTILGYKILPIHLNPIGETNCKANIRKALDPLKNKQIGKKFLWKEDDIFSGDQLVILGLFEDLRRYYDHLPERQGANYFVEGAYLESYNYDENFASKINQIKFIKQRIPEKPQTEQPKVNRSLNFEGSNRELIQKFKMDIIPAPIQQSITQDFELIKHNQTNTTCTTIPRTQGFCELFNFQVTMQGRGEDELLVREWLNQFSKLGEKIKWENKELEEFKDGKILCYLIQCLELDHLEGINQHPRTTAASIGNIRRVFQVLKKKPEMTIELLYDWEKVSQGDKSYIINLLKTMKHIYRNKIPLTNKSFMEIQNSGSPLKSKYSSFAYNCRSSKGLSQKF